ncbi:uncharacterized protein AMSG_05687 [Thecamonas trahens ATCC 50062]|uniref:Mitochondrial import inner membrane translocase subunit TIM50 n=1 Tax=Thecamonas trahens ATCC 50062 TaxID=461836 RepID=A0A0L0DBN5_THETB|nr:hypothetical protein AMSG_05687 [Thecamonas trahens ATCC 50062]KNC49640.1 hypothetical protein AMSG_05687 [Thecamonas trahens ATCC 50062]|eukprot:XP_013757743.1 hypothetical protein AMSG_05687 [Thecamonas trahens ATCC 50062]
MLRVLYSRVGTSLSCSAPRALSAAEHMVARGVRTTPAAAAAKDGSSGEAKEPTPSAETSGAGQNEAATAAAAGATAAGEGEAAAAAAGEGEAAAAAAGEKKRPWWKGPEKDPYDPFDTDYSAPMPLQNPLSTGARISLALLGLFSIGSSTYVLSTFDIPEDHPLYEGKDAGLVAKLVANCKYMYNSIAGESNKPLLPDPLPPPFYKPYTLIVGLDEVLIHTKYDARTGFQTLKRPGMDAFLREVSSLYEVVVWSVKSFIVSGPVLSSIDPFEKMFAYKLYRPSCKSNDDGAPVKDLTRINRPLHRVISIEADPSRVASHPDNVLLVPAWTGAPGDNELGALLPFLRAVVADKVADVRLLLKFYGHENVGRKFVAHMRERRARAALESSQREAARELLAQAEATKPDAE